MQPQVQVGVSAMIYREGEIRGKGFVPLLLMTKRTGSHGADTWQVPGGHAEYGEPFEKAVRREVEEETGMHVLHTRFLGITDDFFEEEGKHYCTLYYECSVPNDEEPRIMEPDKCTEQRWVDYDNPPQPLFLCMENFLYKTALSLVPTLPYRLL
jgi:8-oxo-dGTP diphosphatase